MMEPLVPQCCKAIELGRVCVTCGTLLTNYLFLVDDGDDYVSLGQGVAILLHLFFNAC